MENHIIYLLESSLVITRLMYDHCLILLSLISFKNHDTLEYFEKEKVEYEKLLHKLLEYSNQRVSKLFIESSALVTDYTGLLEQKTCGLFCLRENQELVAESYKLEPNDNIVLSETEVKEIDQLTTTLYDKLEKTIDSLNFLKDEVILGKVSVYFDKDFLEQLVDMTKQFIYTIDAIKRQKSFTPSYIYLSKHHFNKFQENNSLYLKNMISPVSRLLMDEINDFTVSFEGNLNEFTDEVSPDIIESLGNKTKRLTNEFAIYNTNLLNEVLQNRYYLAIVPIFHDLVLREANYVLYQLNKFETIK